MSRPEERSAHRLARELVDTLDAVPILVTLRERGGSTTREDLARACDGRGVDGAIRWLTAVNLVRRASGAGTFDLDEPGTAFELTSIGDSLAGSMIELAKIYTSDAAPKGKATIGEE